MGILTLKCNATITAMLSASFSAKFGAERFVPFRQYTTSIAIITQGRAREIYSINGGILLGIRKYGKNRVIRFASAIVAMIERIFKSI